MAESLVALPHSGLRVPHTDLHVTSARTLPGSDGEMLHAVLRRNGRVVGHLVNEGRGGPTFFQSTGAGFGWRDLEAFVAACRTPAGDQVPDEHVLDVLVDEYRTTRSVTATTKRNLTPLRLCVLLDGLTFRVGHAAAKPITTPERRARLCAELAHAGTVLDGEWWQLWNPGRGWEDLTPRPATT
ncbi:MAG TPA: hypothetical protein VH561_13880 [Micromonosporaceae bacterium]|jgi:hypothetical protein